MKKSGVRRGVLVYKGPDPAGKMEIPVEMTFLLERVETRQQQLKAVAAAGETLDGKSLLKGEI